MAGKNLTLLDVARARGTESAVSIIDNASRFAPEVNAIVGMPINGITYSYQALIQRAKGGFRKGNSGIASTKSEYEKKEVHTYIFGAQLTADKAIADAYPGGAKAWCSQEALNCTEGNFETLGDQLFYGEAASSDGFDGLTNAVTSDMLVSAGGNTADGCTSVFMLWNDPRGCHFVFGNNGSIVAPDEWRLQAIPDDDNNLYDAYVNSMTFWIGLDPGVKCVSRLCNIDATHPVTDKLLAKLKKTHPLRCTPNLIIMNRAAQLQLQESRSATTSRQGDAGKNWAEAPVASNGIPILVTDSIKDTEAVASV